jgi:[protein-PII] uridylyltransferase
MDAIRSRRKIIHRAALQEEAEAIARAQGSDADRRKALLALYKAALERGRAEVERRFFEDGDGALCVAGNAFLIDQLIRVIHDIIAGVLYPAANPTDAERLAIVAVGGYGRGELAPHSDIDLLFLHPYKKNPRIEQVVEAMLYTLWDLGLKVGHATRSVDETLRQTRADITIRTAVLESRFVWGDRRLAGELSARFREEVVRGTSHDFIAAKLAERDARHERMGGSRYVLEPNIKDGKGGLRDLQTLYWTAKYRYQVLDVAELVDKGALTRKEFEAFDRAQRHFWTLRCHLHYLAGRAEERLSFDIQPELARRMGYTDHAGAAAVERFMKHYFLVAKEVGDLTRIFCAGFELADRKAPLLSFAKLARRRQVDGFTLDGGRLTLESPDQFAQDPVDLLRIFDVMQTTGHDIHPDALKAIHRNLRRITRTVQNDPRANRHFLNVLAAKGDPEDTLRRMNECGVFGKFVPDFGRVVAQMQYDMYHVYTTDEHTIRALGILSRIEAGQLKDEHPLASEIVHSIQSREALYVAVLLHEIGRASGRERV